LAADGWSMRLLASELAAFYDGHASQRPSALAALPVRYSDFARWQRSWLQGEALEALLAYWRCQLAGVPSALELPTDRPRGAVRSSRGRRWATELSPALLRRLQELGQRHGVTLFMTLLGAFDVLLSRYSGQADLVVGTPIAQRNQVEIEGLVGLFANTLVLRTDLSREPGFTQLLAQIRETALAAYEHQDLPFAKLVEDQRPERAMSRTPLFQAMLVLQNTPQPPAAVAGLQLQTVDVEMGGAQVDLTLYVAETESGSLAQNWELSADLFDITTVMRWSQHLEALLEAALAAPAQPCASLPLLAAAETAQLLREWNDEAADYPRESTLHQLLAAQVRLTPKAIAVRAVGGMLTYGDLDRRANRLANHLRQLGAGPEQRVAVFMERTCDMVVALLAVLKAGAAYVPLDPTYPEERLALILENTGWPLVVTQQSVAERIDPRRQVVLDRDQAVIDGCPAEDPCVAMNPLALAYLIYTSGSTGRPKGVAITHRSAVSLIAWAGRSFTAAELARVVAATSICFDLSVFELFVPLCHGGSVLLAANALEIPSLPASWRPTLLNTVPAAMAELVRLGAVPASVRTVNLAGEPLPWDLGQQIYGLGTVERLLNLYGPSEDTTYSTGIAVDRSSPLPPSIGRPLDNTLVYLLDHRLAPAPMGSVAELWLGGENLARGYLGRPDLTAERFLPDPFRGEGGVRMYRTGDLARYRPDGTLDFLGRIDHQVKLRGFRIELGEIEAALVAEPGVHAAAVVVREVAGDRRLVAYVEPVDLATAPEVSVLRSALRARLPEFMVPAAFLVLEKLPRTPSQKVDRKALPVPPPLEGEAQEAPATELERLIADAFSAALSRPAVGRSEDFFALGGHSLLATQVVARLRAVLDAEIDLRALFEHPTAADLAAAVERGQGTAGAARPRAVVRSPRTGPVPASLSQERLWFVDRLEPGSAIYNLAVALRIEGPLRVGALRQAMAELCHRHEALRTTFSEVDGTAVQRAVEAPPVPFAHIDLDALPAEKRESVAQELGGVEIARPFDLTTGALVRLCLIRTGAQSHVVVLTTHHIVADGWSLGVLIEDLTALYAGATGGGGPLPPLPVQYADFAVWQRQWLHGEVLESQIGYWTRKLAGAPALTPLPTDRPRPQLQSFHGGRLSWVCPPPVALRLRDLCHRLGATPFMTLLAAFQVLLHAHNGQEDLLVGTPVSYRNWPEIQRVCGFFANTLVIRTDLGGNPDFATLTARVRSTLLEGLAHQDLPLNRLIAELKLERSLSHSPLFQVGFTFGVEPPVIPAPPGLAISPVELDLETTQFDLNLTIAEPAGEGLVGTLHYNRDLFERTTATALLEDYERILGLVSLDCSVRLSDIRKEVARTLEQRRTAIGRTLSEASRASFKSRATRRSRGGEPPLLLIPSPGSDREE
jgi:amino acid adenylation domain-containing protein